MKLADLRVSNRGEAVVAELSGEIDMSNVTELHTRLAEATPNGATGLVLDLTSLDYLDSAGIQLLFRLRADLLKRRQRLLLVLADGSVVAETFRLAGVIGKLEQADSVEHALAALVPEGTLP
jgi:anti-sigma B factor antagonist